MWYRGLLVDRLQKLLVLGAVAAADDAAQTRRGRRQAFEPQPAAAIACAAVGRLVGGLQLPAVLGIERLRVAHRRFLRDVEGVGDEMYVRGLTGQGMREDAG